MAAGPNSLGQSCSSSAGRASFVWMSARMNRPSYCGALERQVEKMPDGAVRAVAADHERRRELLALALAVECGPHAAVALDCRHEQGLVLDRAAPAAELFREELLRDVLGNHGDETVGALLRSEPDVRQAASVRHDGHPRRAVRLFEERAGDPGHVEDLERPGKDGERLGVLRLRRVRLDDPVAEAAASALVREEEPDRPRADDQDIRVSSAAQPSPFLIKNPWSVSPLATPVPAD